MPQIEAIYSSDSKLTLPALNSRALPNKNLGVCRQRKPHQKCSHTKANWGTSTLESHARCPSQLGFSEPTNNLFHSFINYVSLEPSLLNPSFLGWLTLEKLPWIKVCVFDHLLLVIEQKIVREKASANWCISINPENNVSMSLHIFSPSLCIMKWNTNFLLHCLKTEEFLPGQSYTQYHYEHLNAQNAIYCAKRTNYNHRTFICYLDVRKPSSFTLPLLPPFSLFLT